jgi:hypothetical protein
MGNIFVSVVKKETTAERKGAYTHRQIKMGHLGATLKAQTYIRSSGQY